jgi:hypothetical protein
MQKPLQYLCLKRSIYSKNGQSLNILVSPLSVDTFRFNFVHYGSRDHLFTTQILLFSAHL